MSIFLPEHSVLRSSKPEGLGEPTMRNDAEPEESGRGSVYVDWGCFLSGLTVLSRVHYLEKSE